MRECFFSPGVESDIIDEAIYYFKANVFFKNYEIKVWNPNFSFEGTDNLCLWSVYHSVLFYVYIFEGLKSSLLFRLFKVW